jgi:hypothetical protein
MKILILIISLLFQICSCSSINTNSISSNEEIVNNSEEINMILEIDNNILDVIWLNNESVTALNNLKPVTINMRRYGDFEQVGSLGKSIISNDERITTKPGDIVLYSSNQIVIFFNSNTWEYTKLGHIDLSEEELNKLLNKPSVFLNLK